MANPLSMALTDLVVDNLRKEFTSHRIKSHTPIGFQVGITQAEAHESGAGFSAVFRTIPVGWIFAGGGSHRRVFNNLNRDIPFTEQEDTHFLVCEDCHQALAMFALLFGTQRPTLMPDQPPS